MPVISVIIPVYNSEKYIHECLDSILSQSLKDIEVICVDDGSTDNSVQILEEYSQRDSRVKVLRQKNSFAGVARNNGMKAATGEYIHFMDADDYLYENVYDKVYEEIKKRDFPNIVRFKAQPFDNCTKEDVEYKDFVLSLVPQECFKKSCDIERDFETVYRKICVNPFCGFIKNEFVKSNNLEFSNLRCCNDRSFFVESLLLAKEFWLLDLYVVRYRMNNQDSLVGIREKNFDCVFKNYETIKNFLDKVDCSDELKKKVIIKEIGNIIRQYNLYMETYSSLSSFYKIYRATADFIKGINLSPDFFKGTWFYIQYQQLYNAKELLYTFSFLFKLFVFNYYGINSELEDINKNRIVLLGIIKKKIKANRDKIC